MERKSLDLELEVKGDDSGPGEFKAYFAAFGNRDHVGDVIQPGAFKNLDGFLKAGWVDVNHEMKGLPIGYPTTAIQDGKGLLVEGRFHSTPEGQAARTVIRERMQAGKAVKGSIGYRATESEKGTLDGKAIRSLKGIDLFACSLVNLPANDAAEFVHSKGLITPDEARQLVAEFKAGRVLSAENLASMRKWASTLRGYGSIADEIDALCNMHDPPPIVPKSMAEATGLHLQTLALCAKFGLPFIS
jgi:uncharacterized protein